jgi:EAL domain-containing protein (putative c-di-GMP-specific phosphodiesterase class I)
LQQELLEAVRSEVLDVYYQPQIDTQTGHVSGLEALIRWAHPVLGKISPNEFIPLAERNGKILEIGYQVLRLAVGAASAWRREGIWSGELSVNISPRQLSSRELLDQIDEVLSVHEFPPELLVLEITENLAVDSDDSVRERLTELRRRGITLAMDDFGTGHANLTNVVDLPVNKVKLDRSLLPVSHDDERGLHVFTNVVSFIDRLGYEIIAEGVETGEQLAIAHEAGCRYIQGYFFSPPLAERRIQKLLTNGISVTQSAESRRSA